MRSHCFWRQPAFDSRPCSPAVHAAGARPLPPFSSVHCASLLHGCCSAHLCPCLRGTCRRGAPRGLAPRCSRCRSRHLRTAPALPACSAPCTPRRRGSRCQRRKRQRSFWGSGADGENPSSWSGRSCGNACSSAAGAAGRMQAITGAVCGMRQAEGRQLSACWHIVRTWRAGACRGAPVGSIGTHGGRLGDARIRSMTPELEQLTHRIGTSGSTVKSATTCSSLTAGALRDCEKHSVTFYDCSDRYRSRE